MAARKPKSPARPRKRDLALIDERKLPRGKKRHNGRTLARCSPPPADAAVPLFPITAFTPHSRCPHHGPIRRGSLLVCMVCHDSSKRAQDAAELAEEAERDAECQRQATRERNAELWRRKFARYAKQTA